MNKTMVQGALHCCILIFALCIFAAVPLVAAAAGIAFDASSLRVKTGDDVAQTVRVISDEEVNAVEGRMIFPHDLLTLKEIRTGNSAIVLWLEAPYEESSGTVRFSGITPGGYRGTGELFTVVFGTKNDGTGRVGFSGLRILKNDGAGTPVSAAASTLTIEVSSRFPSSAPMLAEDHTPPEPFTPVISRDPSLFDNRYVIVFATADKGVGIDHYEVAEVPPWTRAVSESTWTRADSPHALIDQNLTSDTYIRAIDKSGNIRTEKVSAVHRLFFSLTEFETMILITFLCGGMVVLMAWKSRRRAR